MKAIYRLLVVLCVSSVALAACGGGGGGGPGTTTYSVTYDKNGATSGTVPVDSTLYATGAAVTVLGNTGNLAKTGQVFAGWSPLAAGAGNYYSPGLVFNMGSANVVLYAQWASPSGFTVTYDANGATGGAVPVDAARYNDSQSVTVAGNPGNLTYPGYTLMGWQAKADGSGTTYKMGSTFQMGSANVALYALWAGGYAYAVNWSDTDVSQYTIGPNGALTPMFTPTVSTVSGQQGYDPRWLTVDPSGKYLYVSNYHGVTSITGCTYGCGFVSQFTIGADGSLAPMSTPTFFTAGAYPGGGAIHPTKPWYYVANLEWNTISQNTIGADGSLAAMTPPIVTTAAGPNTIAIDPLGKYAYVPNGNTVSQYTIDQTSGTLQSMSPSTVAAGLATENIGFASLSSGTYAYVLNGGGGTTGGSVSQYKIDPASGGLSQIETVAADPDELQYASSLTVHPTGKFAYATLCCASPSKVIVQFKVDPTTGKLTRNGMVSAGGKATAWIAIESSGKYAYATSGDSGWGSYSVAQYTIDQTTGSLTLMPNPTVLAGFGPSQIVTVGK